MKTNYTIRCLLAISALSLSASVAATSLVCSSDNGQNRYCPADTRGGVTLQTQFSRAGCYQGSSWGYDNNGIWVANGCRAEFQLGNVNYNRGDSHKDGKAAAALAIALIGAAAVASHHHKDQHTYQQPARNPNPWNKGYRPPDTNNGYRGGGYEYNGQPYDIVRCESVSNNWQRCPAMINRASVSIQRQLSRSACRYGSDWHYDGAAIYVQNGCRADFVIRP